MEKQDKDRLKNISESTDNPVIKQLAQEQLATAQLSTAENDEVTNKMIALSQMLGNVGKAQLDEAEVKVIVRNFLKENKISIQDLDNKLKKIIDGIATPVNVSIQLSTQTIVKKTINVDNDLKRPLIQKVLSDVEARNNVYLYGGAGTGKSFSAITISKALGWDLIEVNCNQFTSQLDLIGGQTIDGYQEGAVIKAFGNLDDEGNSTGRGCVLLLDELPKIDPNTAGLLNSALAKVGQYETQTRKNPTTGKEEKIEVPSTIKNGRGERIERGQCFIMGTGNSLLNSFDAEYEANFKQDLSLQDRFAGSTYLVRVDRKYEWEDILKQEWCFIYIYLSKLRDKIEELNFTSKAFVSIRLMQSAKKTYYVSRVVKDAKGKNPTFSPNENIDFTPASTLAISIINKKTVKTIIDTVDEFFSLFSSSQADELRDKTDYSEFKRIVAQKDRLPLSDLNTEQEMEEVKQIIRKK